MFCLRVAWCRRARHIERVAQWGKRTTKAKNRTLPVPNNCMNRKGGLTTLSTGDRLTPLRRVLLMEELGVL